VALHEEYVYAKKNYSRKGAKAQSAARCKGFLCVFAPLRQTIPPPLVFSTFVQSRLNC
jgi:hypothetical protein